MTVIAALVQDGKVHMASDTAGNIDGRISHHPDKVFTLPVPGTRRRAVLGFAGNGALGALAQAHLGLGATPEPAASRTDWRAWAVSIATVVCELAVEAQPSPRDSDGWVDGYALLGHAGRLWMLAQHDACEVMDPFAAIGSGGDVALGVLSVLPGDLMPAREQLEAAVESACRFDTDCAVGPAGMRYEVV